MNLNRLLGEEPKFQVGDFIESNKGSWQSFERRMINSVYRRAELPDGEYFMAANTEDLFFYKINIETAADGTIILYPESYIQKHISFGRFRVYRGDYEVK